MKCPICGSEMILKTARKGKNAGKQFYGCSQWKVTGCKGIVNIDDSDQTNTQDSQQTSNSQNDNSEIDLPIFLNARAKSNNFQVRFVETVALPKTLLENIFQNKVKRDDLKYKNQWRIDFPLSRSDILNEQQRQIFLVAHKILTRGRITQTSPYIEKSVLDLFGLDYQSSKKFLDLAYLDNLFTNDDLSKYYLDGFGTEHLFFLKVLPQILGENYKKYVLPQVELSSLIGDDISQIDNRRVDFLITIGDKKIVVELEGTEHEEHTDSDRQREELLIKNGYEVFRIKNEEIQNQVGVNFQRFIDSIPKPIHEEKEATSNEALYLLSIKIIHQIQITLLEAILNGHIELDKNSITYFDVNSLTLDKELQYKLINIAQADFQEIIYNLSKIYNYKIDVGSLAIRPINQNVTDGIIISYNSGLVANKPVYIIQDIAFPNSIAQLDRPTNYAVLDNPDPESIKYFLNYIFRHDDFLEGQLEAIVRTLRGDDSIVLLPTGAGKSVAFQLTGIILPGVTIVIDPLISLIDDQIDNLVYVGIDRIVGITSQITDPKIKSKLIKIFGQGEYLFCYIAPERFQTKEFRDTLKSLTVSTPISIIVIDEAHCVSEWGHNFRTSYLNIGRVSRERCKYQDHIPPLLALTGTASNSVLRDVQRELQIEDLDAIITPQTFDRQELFFNVFESPSDQKFTILKGILQRVLPQNFNLTATSFYQSREGLTHSGILFCPHVGGPFGAKDNSDTIKQQLGINTKYYAGKKPKFWNNALDWNSYKRTTAKEFKTNHFPLLVATKSFGMGIDKPNIRYTIHYGLPFSVESFYQEAGRAGRDRQRAECYMLISNDNVNRTQEILEPSKTIEDISKIMKNNRTRADDDDITRAVYFHLIAFKGLDNELSDIRDLIQNIGNLENQRKISTVFSRLDRNSSEKSIHRLLTLGIVSDYTINYSNNEYTIDLSGLDKQGIIDTYCRYVSGYNKGRVRIEKQKMSTHLNKSYSDFVIDAAKVLINFIYDTIEKGRRRALREILTIAESAKSKSPEESNEIIRERILKYLETSYSEEIEEVLNEIGTFNSLQKIVEGDVVTETGEIVGGIRSVKDVLEIRGQVARYLQSYPDQPGLLFLRAISELFAPDSDNEIINQNINAAINFSLERYSIDKKVLFNTLCWILSLINNKSNGHYKEIIDILLYSINDIEFAKGLLNYSDAEINMIYQPGVYLFSKYARVINSLYK